MGSKENMRRQIAIQVVYIESLIPEDYYLREIMREIVRQCVAAGLVKGDVLAADGTIV